MASFSTVAGTMSVGRSAVRRISLIAPLLLGLQGCEFTASPSLPFYGAYFPFWLLCAAVGVLGSVLVRMLLNRCGDRSRCGP